MSCSARAPVFFDFSRLFVRIQRWALLHMSLNCNSSGLNARFPANFKVKRAKESVHGPNGVRKWKRKLLLLWILGVVTIGTIWVLLIFRGDVWGRNGKTLDCCDEKARILLQHYNVSGKQLHALASLFSESDQIRSLNCNKEPGLDMPQSDGITCALKVLCSEMQEFEKQNRRVDEKVEPNDQCPVEPNDQSSVQDKNISSNLDLSIQEENSVLFGSQSTLSSLKYENHEKGTLHTRTSVDLLKDPCENFCPFLVKGCWWLLIGMVASFKISGFCLKFQKERKHKIPQLQPVAQQQLLLLQQKHQHQAQSPPRGAGKWRRTLLRIFILLGIIGSVWLFWHLNEKIILRREETLANMCDERARMLQDQFNVSMNHVHALAILVSTFHHGKNPSAINQKTFGEYTERTAFERPLTSGVAYALKVLHSEREQFERQHGLTIKKMETEDQTLVQDCMPDNLDPAPLQDEYAPVIFSQETVSHIVSIDMMSGKEDRENILRARATGKGVLTSPFKLLKSNHLGVVLTFAVYSTDLPPDATPEQRIEAAVGYLGASYDVPSLVEKLLHQLASKQTIVVNVYDTTNASAPISMYGTDVEDTGLLQISNLDFGDPLRKHEMHCRFKHKPSVPWTAINASVGVLVITLLLGHIFHAAISRIAKVEDDCQKMMELKARAEAADVAKSQFLATVSHEIRTPMNGVLGMLQLLMDTNLDANQMDCAKTAHASGKDLISLINEVLDQAKIESGRLELERVPFDIRAVLDNVLSLFSRKSFEKGIELAIYVSNQVPDVVIGDPGRFRQIITNLVGNSIKFTHDKGHIFVSVHLADEARDPHNIRDEVLRQGSNLVEDSSNQNTLSGFPVVNRWKSWETFKTFSGTETQDPEKIELLVTVEDTGVGIPPDAQDRIFTPFMQADSSTSRTYGGTGIGLSISKRLVELMDGDIGFVSKCGIGSTFSFTGAFTSSVDIKGLEYAPVVSDFRGLMALIIDNRSIRAAVTRYHLQRLGISVKLASSMASACCHLSNTCSTSVFAHLSMVLIDGDVWNKEDGLAFHRLLKEHKQNGSPETSGGFPKIFLLDTSVTPMGCNEIKSSGFIDNVLLKPLRLSVLIACFQEALGSGKKTQVNAKKQVNLGSLLKERRILVVDDNLVNRRVAEGVLKKYGAIVVCVESGRAALEMLKPAHNFDACFMDLQMPEMDGFEATRQIRAMEREVNEKIASGEASATMFRNMANWHIPILAMTADVIQATNEECMKCGMDDYVSKPFGDGQLYTAVARFFESG